MTIRVFLLDDHEVVRRGVAALLESESDIEVVGEAATAAHAVARIPAVRPDVAILDISMPDLDGDDPCGAARKQHLREPAGRGADIEAETAGRIETEGVEPGGELHASARHVRVGRRGLDRDIRAQHEGGPGDRLAIRLHEAGGDGRLRARPAFEIAALDEQQIGALALGHRGSIIALAGRPEASRPDGVQP